MDRRYDQRFEAQEHAVTLALSRVDKEFHEHLRAAREETQAALTAADKAIGKSEVAAEKRFESVNEFRGQQGDIVATFIPRTEAEQRIAQNIEKIDSIEKRMTQAFASMGSRLDIAQGSKQGYAQLIGFIFGAVGVVAALIGVAIALR